MTTGVWPGFTCSTAFLTTPMECRIIATLWALSRNSGSWAVGLMVRANCGWRLALNAYHDMFSSVPVLPSVIRLACSSHMYSSPVCSLKLSLVKDTMLVAGTDMYVLHVGCAWGHISIVVWQAVDYFRACLSRTTNDCNASVHSFASERGCWRREIAVPWKDHFAVVELALWSILSMADVVKTLLRIFGEQTTCSL